MNFDTYNYYVFDVNNPNKKHLLIRISQSQHVIQTECSNLNVWLKYY